jgi:hypothetical protein
MSRREISIILCFSRRSLFTGIAPALCQLVSAPTVEIITNGHSPGAPLLHCFEVFHTLRHLFAGGSL